MKLTHERLKEILNYDLETGILTWKIRNGKQIYLGLFATTEEAYFVYCKAAKKYHGEFANFG